MNTLIGNVVFGPPSTVGRARSETTEQYHKRISSKPHITADTLRAGAITAAVVQAKAGPTYQSRVAVWLEKCFGSVDLSERNHRFLEEALELVQSTGCTASEAHQLVDYVFSRPVGDPPQEVGGVMVCLAGLCVAAGLNMYDAGEAELTRVDTPAMIEKIRRKWLTKPKHSPLPGPPAPKHSVEAALDQSQGMREAAERVIFSGCNTYRKPNGQVGTIEGDDGEMCWIVSFDDFEALRAALDQLVAPSDIGKAE